jgi:hypothetical protein
MNDLGTPLDISRTTNNQITCMSPGGRGVPVHVDPDAGGFTVGLADVGASVTVQTIEGLLAAFLTAMSRWLLPVGILLQLAHLTCSSSPAAGKCHSVQRHTKYAATRAWCTGQRAEGVQVHSHCSDCGINRMLRPENC